MDDEQRDEHHERRQQAWYAASTSEASWSVRPIVGSNIVRRASARPASRNPS
jgi:hypothetical protein